MSPHLHDSWLRRVGLTLCVLTLALTPVSVVGVSATDTQPIITNIRLITDVQPAQLQIIGMNLTAGIGCATPTIFVGGVSQPVITFTDTLVTAQIDDTIANNSGTYRVVLEDCDPAHSVNSFVVIGVLGPEGSSGPSGAQGPKGRSPIVAGPAGASGVSGARGAMGPSGFTGSLGALGGSGATGAQGSTGPVGLIGPSGLAGASGATGPSGPLGPSGPSGPFRALGGIGSDRTNRTGWTHWTFGSERNIRSSRSCGSERAVRSFRALWGIGSDRANRTGWTHWTFGSERNIRSSRSCGSERAVRSFRALGGIGSDRTNRTGWTHWSLRVRPEYPELQDRLDQPGQLDHRALSHSRGIYGPALCIAERSLTGRSFSGINTSRRQAPLQSKPSREELVSFTLLLAILVVNLLALSPELLISRVDLNDNVFHFTLVDSMVRAIERGSSGLDSWSPEWSFGYPVLRTYQPLAHGLVALVYFCLGKTVTLMTVFVWVRYLSVALLPLTFFVTARLMRFSPLEAAAAALLSPLISTNFLYGIEYGSYLWAGSGLFTQAIATHFFLLSIGLAFRALPSGRHLALTGVLVALAFLSNFIYGYMAALTICLLAVIPDERATLVTRARRLVFVGVVTFLLVAWELVPMLADVGIINHSRWESVWKWDSFGAGQILAWLFTGELLDHGRLPVLSLLVLLGIGATLWAWRSGTFRRAQLFVAAGAIFWILVYFGRPFWGPALELLGATPDLQLHRTIGAVHVFLVLLGAFGLAAIWRALLGTRRAIAAILITAVLLYPAFRERGRFLSNNDSWGRRNLTAFASERASVDGAIADLQTHGGRAYAGLAASWGGSFKIGDVPFYAFLSRAHVPAVAFLYHSMALTGDVMVRFNEWEPDHYRLFNVRSVVAPSAANSARIPCTA